MQVTINIPQPIIDQCRECEYTDEQIIKLVTHVVENVFLSNDYNRFTIDFDAWLNDVDEDELKEILES